MSGAEIRIGVRDSRRNVFTTDTELNFDSLRNAEIIVANAVIPGNFLRPERYCMTLAVVHSQSACNRFCPRRIFGNNY